MTPDPYDFRQPPPTGLEAKAQQWLKEACGIAPRVWPKLLTFQAEMSLEWVKTFSAAQALDEFPIYPVSFRLQVSGAPECAPLLTLSRPLLIAMINGSLGTPPATIPPNRDLSTVENSVCNFIVQQLLLDILGEGWPASDHPQFTIATRGEPRGVLTLPPNDLIILGRMTIKAPFGEHPVFLMMPRELPLTELLKPAVDPVPVKVLPREEMEAIVGELPVELQVILGSTEVTMLQLAKLQPGDLVVLGQKVGEPLQAKVAGRDKFSVWPGAVGRRQAIQIDHLIENA